MKHTIASVLFVAASAFSLNAQNVTLFRGGQAPNQLIKNTTPISFMLNGDHYFINRYYDKSMMNYHLQSFNSKGIYIEDKNIEVNPGTFNNTYSIDDLAIMAKQGYVLVEHLDKASGKNTLLARAFDNQANVGTTETELMVIPFEKIMNSGFNNSDVSADRKTLAVVSEMPFVKEQPAQFKIAVFDQDLKKVKEGEITLPGENTKNKSMSAIVGNDGTVYIIKKGMTKKGEITLAVYQWSSGTEVKEYIIELSEPNNIFNYTYEVNDKSEIVVSGMYYERKTLTVGEKQAVGVFFLTNKNKSERVFTTFKLDAPVDNLTARQLLLNGNTIFLAAEQYKEERITPPASASGAANWDYNYDYTHKNEFVIAMDTDGNKKFQLEMNKDFKARDFDKQHYSSYAIVNGKFTIVYNDQTKKYTKESYYYQYMIPVLVQISNDGLMQSPVVFKDDLKLDQAYALYPVFFTQEDNQLNFLMENSSNIKFLGVKIEDKQ